VFGPEDFRRYLRQVIASARVDGEPVSLRRLDRLSGRHPGYWSQVFRGKPRMTVDHVFEALAALGHPAEEFFLQLAERFRGQGEDEELARQLLETIRRVTRPRRAVSP
jgi:hypothetical protein